MKKKCLVLSMVLMVATAVGCGEKNYDNEKDYLSYEAPETTEGQETTEEQESTENVGDDTFYIDASGKAHLKVGGGALLGDGREIYYQDLDMNYQPGSGEVGDGYRIVKISFECVNNSNTLWWVGTGLFKCYADDYEVEEVYGADDRLEGANVDPGRKAKGSVYFQIPVGAQEIEVVCDVETQVIRDEESQVVIFDIEEGNSADNSSAPHEADVSSEIDYGYIYGGVLDGAILEASENGEDADCLKYALYDIDKDGYCEFFIQSGIVYEVYTTNGEVNSLLGEIDASNTGLYICEGENGVYTDYCHMDYESIALVKIKNGALEEQVIFEGENRNYGYDSNGNAFKELQSPIEVHTVGEGFIY